MKDVKYLLYGYLVGGAYMFLTTPTDIYELQLMAFNFVVGLVALGLTAMIVWAGEQREKDEQEIQDHIDFLEEHKAQLEENIAKLREMGDACKLILKSCKTQ